MAQITLTQNDFDSIVIAVEERYNEYIRSANDASNFNDEKNTLIACAKEVKEILNKLTESNKVESIIITPYGNHHIS